MNSEQDILNELQQLNSPLAVYPRTMPYALPEGYFEDVVAQLNTTIAADMQVLNRDMPFSLPDGYFEKLPDTLLQAAKETPAATPKQSSTMWLGVRWAAAAMLVIAIGFGSYRALTPETQSIEQQLNNIPDAELMAYVQENIDDFETDNIITHINNTGISNATNALNSSDIELYLQETGWQ